MKLVSGIVDSGFFAQSALSAEVATKDSLGRNISETYLTGVDLTPYQTTEGMTAYANSAEVTGTAQYGLTTAGWSEITGGGVTGDFELKEGNGIQLTDDPIAQTTTISVSGDYATNTQLQTVSGEITAMIPSTAGLATEDFVTSQGYITNDAITGKQDITGMTAYATVESLTAKQDAGDYLSATDSANFLLTSDSGNFYTTANESGFISEVPSTYLQNTDLSTTDGKVTAISGIPLSAGGDVPEGVMVESGLEYNAVNEISGYNGSAIAQYGAEKQFIVHDDTLCHLSNSAQFALGVNLSAVAQLLGIDETVLFFAGNDSSGYQSGNLTESIKNFETVKVVGMDNDAHIDVKYIYPQWTHNADNGTANITNYEVMFYGANPYQNTVWEKWVKYSFSALTAFTVSLGYEGSYTANTISNVTNNHKFSIREVIGIGRKEV